MANFVNINNSAQNFTIPMPFQHFTGDYATATQISTPAAVSADGCYIECQKNSDCEFFKFVPPSTCQLFNSGSQTIVSGVKIDTRRKTLNMSNTFSTLLPQTTVLSTTPSVSSTQDCESSCNSNPRCFVYGYDIANRNCTLYSSVNNSGNVGVSLDILQGIPTITLSTPTQKLTSIVFTGTASSSLFGRIEILSGGSVVASGTVSDFTGAAGITLYSGATGTYTARYQLKQGVVSSPVSFTYAAPTITNVTTSSVNGKGFTVSGTLSSTIPVGTQMVFTLLGTNYTLGATSSLGSFTFTFSNQKRLWTDNTSQSLKVAVESALTIVSSTITV
jgi:hypothetical protein